MPSRDVSKKQKGKPDHSQLAYEGIRRMLFHNEISPGQKISYRQLAEKMDMSLTPVVQALKRLEHQGLVRHEPNRGYFTEPMRLEEVQEIYEMRELIEVSLLPEILKRIDKKGIRRLRKLVDSIEKSSNGLNLNKRLVLDKEFHLALAAMSGRRTQLQILNYLYDLLYLKYRAGLLFVAAQEMVGSQHETIINAVESLDVDKAAEALKQHFRTVKKHALTALAGILAEKENFRI